jgi:hypothetical protein
VLRNNIKYRKVIKFKKMVNKFKNIFHFYIISNYTLATSSTVKTFSVDIVGEDTRRRLEGGRGEEEQRYEGWDLSLSPTSLPVNPTFLPTQ